MTDDPMRIPRNPHGVYYFRRPVSKEDQVFWRGPTGKVKKEWSKSLRTKDKPTAHARFALAAVEYEAERERQWLRYQAGDVVDADASGAAAVSSCRETEEKAAKAAVEAARQQRYDARKELRIAVRERMMLSTAELSPQEAAWRDLVREKEADASALELAVSGQQEANVSLARKMGKSPSGGPRMSIMSLFDDWSAERGKPDTVAQNRSYVESFRDFVKDVDASTVTEGDVVAWRNHLKKNGGRSGKAITSVTINTGYITALRSVFKFARYETGRLKHDPTEGIKALKGRKQQATRERSIRDSEALTILADAMEEGGEKLSPHRAAAKRWCQWLMAYTGARVLEIAQLRKQDVGVEDGVPYVVITPEAGKQKTETVRKVALHPHLIQQGFLAYVASQPDGHLFYDPTLGRGGRLASQSKKVGEYLCKRVRALGIDVPQPNHGWRHRMETMNQRYELRDKTVRAILGHSAPDSNGGYGDAELGVMLREVGKIPAYQGPGLPLYLPEGTAAYVAGGVPVQASSAIPRGIAA